MTFVHPRRLATVTLAALCLAATGFASPLRTATDDPAAAWQEARQMVVVTVPEWQSTQGTLRTYRRQAHGDWHPVDPPRPVVIGKGGAGWGLGLQPPQHDGPVKQEGDGRSPAGVFHIGIAFGYAAHADTGLSYHGMTASDWCVDVSGSPHYNRIVDADAAGKDAVKGATEPMRRDIHVHGDQRYRQGFVIESNWQQQPMAGSCVFGHLWKSSDTSTTGCTAMAPRTMGHLLAWLDADKHPVMVLLPESAYAAVRATWKLPVLDTEQTGP